jgi:hypothetical protein
MNCQQSCSREGDVLGWAHHWPIDGMRTESMSSDKASATAVDTALRALRDTLAADGYELVWFMERETQIGIRVVPGPDACADCLVPPELMRTIVDGELAATPYRVGSISLPPKS